METPPHRKKYLKAINCLKISFFLGRKIEKSRPILEYFKKELFKTNIPILKTPGD